MAAENYRRFNSYVGNNTAPKKKASPKKGFEPYAVPKKKINSKQLKNEEKASRIWAFRIIAICAALLVVFGSVIYGRAKIFELEKEYKDLETQYNEAQSEKIRLESTVESMYSIGNISAYAETNLGMIKKDSCQINYYSVPSDKS